MDHQPDYEEMRALRVLVRDAIEDAAMSGTYSVTLGRYRVRAERRWHSFHLRRIEFEISERKGILERGVVNMPSVVR